jgi:hypothetical protein
MMEPSSEGVDVSGGVNWNLVLLTSVENHADEDDAQEASGIARQ